MRYSLPLCIVLVLLSANQSFAQQLRPAVMEPGPHALINLIDGPGLLKRGQGDAIVRFDFFVNRSGQAGWVDTFMRSNNSDKFARELIDKTERSAWIPAVWHGEKVWSIVSATGIFAVINGQPKVRVYLNQEEEHLKKGDDFISPQPVFSYKDKFQGFYDADEGRYSGMVAVKLQLDNTGKVLGATPTATQGMAGRGFLKSIEERIHNLLFIPAFSHGAPVASTTTWNLPHRGYGHSETWSSD